MNDIRIIVKASLVPDNAIVKKVTGTYLYKFIKHLTVDQKHILPQKGCGFLLPHGKASDNIYSISADLPGNDLRQRRSCGRFPI